jgi:hypothetical protein
LDNILETAPLHPPHVMPTLNTTVFVIPYVYNESILRKSFSWKYTLKAVRKNRVFRSFKDFSEVAQSKKFASGVG